MLHENIVVDEIWTQWWWIDQWTDTAVTRPPPRNVLVLHLLHMDCVIDRHLSAPVVSK